MWAEEQIAGTVEQCSAHILNPGVVWDSLLTPHCELYLGAQPALLAKLWS